MTTYLIKSLAGGNNHCMLMVRYKNVLSNYCIQLSVFLILVAN